MTKKSLIHSRRCTNTTTTRNHRNEYSQPQNGIKDMGSYVVALLNSRWNIGGWHPMGISNAIRSNTCASGMSVSPRKLSLIRDDAQTF